MRIKLATLMPGEWVSLMFNARVHNHANLGKEISTEAVIEAERLRGKTFAAARVKIEPAVAGGIDVKADKGVVNTGEQVTFTITVNNFDFTAANKLKITNKIPKELRLVRGSATTDCGLKVTEDGERGQVIWKKGTLPAATNDKLGNCVVSFQTSVAQGTAANTIITNTATAKAMGLQTLTGGVQTIISPTSTASVDMMDNFFAPKDLMVSPGTVITWTHRGNSAHTVMSAPCSTVMVSSDGLFKNGLSQGNAFSFLVPMDTRPGTVIYYFCRFHGAPGNCTEVGTGMAGTIMVK